VGYGWSMHFFNSDELPYPSNFPCLWTFVMCDGLSWAYLERKLIIVNLMIYSIARLEVKQILLFLKNKMSELFVPWLMMLLDWLVIELPCNKKFYVTCVGYWNVIMHWRSLMMLIYLRQHGLYCGEGGM
jgi:hypothetical protein